jgi:hypothetical protein
VGERKRGHRDDSTIKRVIIFLVTAESLTENVVTDNSVN